MKAVLMSIKPKWCELIASGEKTVEVRKTAPKIEVPFKVYIYATKPKNYYSIGGHLFTSDESLYLINGKVRKCNGFGIEHEDSEFKHLNGKIIGEFVCDKIDGFHYGVQTPYDATSWQSCYEGYPEELYNMDETCLTSKEINDYGNKKFLFAWYISNLVIYDKPKELNELSRHDDTYDNCFGWMFEDRDKNIPITRPPQSWYYVEQLQDKE